MLKITFFCYVENFKDPVCFVIDIVTVCILHLQKIIYVYNYANKTISNSEEYVKCGLQMCVHIIFNQYITCIHFL
jgi:hypothetical protein